MLAEVGRAEDPVLRELHRLLGNAQQFQTRTKRGTRAQPHAPGCPEVCDTHECHEAAVLLVLLPLLCWLCWLLIGPTRVPQPQPPLLP